MHAIPLNTATGSAFNMTLVVDCGLACGNGRRKASVAYANAGKPMKTPLIPATPAGELVLLKRPYKGLRQRTAKK
jgi:hypothetical protein